MKPRQTVDQSNQFTRVLQGLTVTNALNTCFTVAH